MPNMLWRPGQHTRNGACALLFALLLSCAAAAAATEAAASEDVTPTEQTPSEAEPAVEAKPVPENIRNLLLWILQNDGIVRTSCHNLLFFCYGNQTLPHSSGIGLYTLTSAIQACIPCAEPYIGCANCQASMRYYRWTWRWARWTSGA